MTSEEKTQIDKMDYVSMLSLWLRAPVGHPLFQRDTGVYFAQVMEEKRTTVGNAAHVAASKSVL